MGSIRRSEAEVFKQNKAGCFLEPSPGFGSRSYREPMHQDLEQNLEQGATEISL